MDSKFISDEIDRLEDIELKEGDNTKEDVYKYLIVFYLINDEPMKAKFLWKRLPNTFKQTDTSELGKIWKICQNIITRKYSIVFQLSVLYNEQWSTNDLRALINKLIEKTREDLITLISNAYSSINIKEFSNMLNLSNEETLKLALSRNWTIDPTNTFLIPEKKPKESPLVPSSLKQLHQLTTIVSYIDS